MFNFISIYIYIDAVALAALVTLATYLCSKNADWWWQQHVRVTGCSTYIQTCITERVSWLSAGTTASAAPAPAVAKPVEERLRGRITAKEPPRESGFTRTSRSPSPFYAEQQKIMQQQQLLLQQKQQQQKQEKQKQEKQEKQEKEQQQQEKEVVPPERPRTPRDSFESLFAPPQKPASPAKTPTPRATTPGGRNVLSMVKRWEPEKA